MGILLDQAQFDQTLCDLDISEVKDFHFGFYSTFLNQFGHFIDYRLAIDGHA